MSVASPLSPFSPPRKTYTELGGAVPHLPHAISVSLPTWKDVVGYEEGEKRVVDSMKTGYPRFFIHKSIQLLAAICETKFGTPGERGMLFPNAPFADACRAFIRRQSTQTPPVRIVQYIICPSTTAPSTPPVSKPNDVDVNDIPACIELYIVFLPADSWPLAKAFWQHTGHGVSSRLAERCLLMLGIALEEGNQNGVTPNNASQIPSPPVAKRSSRYGTAKYQQKRSSYSGTPTSPSITPPPAAKHDDDAVTADQTTYLEERYGRNLPLASSSIAKRALRRRIAGVLVRDVDGSSVSPALVQTLGESVAELEQKGALKTLLGESKRGGGGVTEDDVYLFATGMCAIWHAHQMAMGVVEKEKGLEAVGKSVCFGFPYTDTLKILEKFGPGCHFLGNGLDSDIDEHLIPLLQNGGTTPILSLFCEFPSNPLLRSANLPRLRKLADEYGFVLVVDETIGNFVNVDVLKYADVVVSSLTKVFSGETNVMGGGLVLNPHSRYYASFKQWLEEKYDEAGFYYGEDAVFLERNSREFQKRVDVINKNAEKVAEFLRERSRAYNHQKRPNGEMEGEAYAIDEVFYPKWVTRENFDACRNRRDESKGEVDGGYGGLLSMTFTSDRAAQRFFDALRCEKGPSLGTNFTLACPYTVLAHYTELDWAASWGVPKTLVRVSVGLEDAGTLLDWFGEALEDASRL